MKIEINQVERESQETRQRALCQPGNIVTGYDVVLLVVTEPSGYGSFNGLVLENLNDFDDVGEVSEWSAGNFSKWQQFKGSITLTYED